MRRVHGNKGSVKYGTPGVLQDEIQTIVPADGTDGGTFRVQYGGTCSAALAWNISTADLQTALRALHADLAACVVTGTPGVTYTMTIDDDDADLVEVANDNTTDGGVWEGGVVVTRTQAGGTGQADIPIKGFDLNKGVPTADATTNATGGFEDVTQGNKRASGTVTCLWDADQEGEACPTEVEEGDEVTLQLYPTDEGGYWNMPALITDAPIRVSDGGTTAWTFSFTSKGAYAWVPAA